MQNCEDVQLAASALAERFGQASLSGAIGIVVGTGLGAMCDNARQEPGSVEVPWTSLHRFPISSVPTHAGTFLLSRIAGLPVLVQNGRCHLYEGRSPAEVCMGVRVMAALGIRTLILTNAAGALNPLFEAGQLMLIADMINFTGRTPLAGVNCDSWGERFPDMSCPFDTRLQALALESALRLGIRLQRGVYIGVHGPQMETPAETRMYRQWGADAVGMSTVLEVIAARHMGLRVLGLSVLTNKNLPDCMRPAPLEEVVAAANAASGQMLPLIHDIVAAIAHAAGSSAASRR